MNNIDIVYTMWSNLKKLPSFEVGQVAFHSDKEVRKVRIEKKINEIVNRLNKTKTSAQPDFRVERENRDARERADKKAQLRDQKEKQKADEKKRAEEAELRSYNSLMQEEKMSTNYDAGNDSDEFM
jgi:uncharacterized membrane protein YukC